MSLDWTLIRSFLAVSEAGSLLAAARKLGLSQPALGRHISALEAELGTRLFIRSASGMKPTDAALDLIEDARAMSAEANRFALKAAGHDNRIKGTVRVTASQIAATYYLPSILAGLRAQEPEIEIELVASNSLANLLARDADIAIRMIRPTQNDLVAVKVNELTLGAFAHRSYLARRGKPMVLKDIFSHDLIGYDREDFIERGMASLGIKASRAWFAFRTDDQVAGWELMKSGAGIGFGSVYLASLCEGVEQVIPELSLPPLPVWLASHQDVRTSRRIRRVMDYLKQALQATPLNMPGLPA